MIRYRFLLYRKIWASSKLAEKAKFQKMMFPEGISYDLENRSYRTNRVNTVILQIAHLAKVLGKNKKRNPSKNEKDSALVHSKGIELFKNRL